MRGLSTSAVRYTTEAMVFWSITLDAVPSTSWMAETRVLRTLALREVAIIVQ